MMDYGGADKDAIESDLKNLRNELKKTRECKKELFACWENTTSSEEQRRALLAGEDDKDVTLTSVTQSTTNVREVLSPLTMADDHTSSCSIDEKTQAVANTMTVAYDCVPVKLNLN